MRTEERKGMERVVKGKGRKKRKTDVRSIRLLQV
jgi:hypothetical protein